MSEDTQKQPSERFQELEQFVQEAWTLVTGPNCTIDVNTYDLESTVGIHDALLAHNKAETFLANLETTYRRNVVYFNVFERDVESLFGIFFRREFMPLNPKDRGITQHLYESAADEAFLEKYDFNRNNVKNVGDFFTELKSMIVSRHDYMKSTYWVIKDSLKNLELAYTTHNTGISYTSSSPNAEPSIRPAQMPRVRGQQLPEPAMAPPSLPPEFLRGFSG